jgi:hypothetical protein
MMPEWRNEGSTDLDRPVLLTGVNGGKKPTGGLDGLGSMPGSSRNRRPRIAAPNPTSYRGISTAQQQWPRRFKIGVLWLQYRV